MARELLAPVYGWFTEGFDRRDLKESGAPARLIGGAKTRVRDRLHHSL